MTSPASLPRADSTLWTEPIISIGWRHKHTSPHPSADPVLAADLSQLGWVREQRVDDICEERLLYDAEDRLQLVVEYEIAPSIWSGGPRRWRPKLPLLVLDGDRAELGSLVPHPRRGFLDDYIRNRDTFDCMVADRMIGRIVRRDDSYGITDSDGQVVASIRPWDRRERRRCDWQRELCFPEPDTLLRPFALAALICGSPALGRLEFKYES